MKTYYHSDHLGSASFVTNRGGGVVQHLQYLPYGELFVSQRNSEEFDSRYKFTAKELDNETSYTYFGARYYDSDLSGWLSVDPMSDKYPSLSPYCYTANNPVMLVDPNGEKVYIVGDAADEATSQLQNNFKNIKITRNEKTGELSYEGKAKTLKEQFIVKAIEKTDIEIQVSAGDRPILYKGEYAIGIYMGNEIMEENGVRKAIGYQFVNPKGLGKMDENTHSYIGESMLHEVAEAFIGCEIALNRNTGSPSANEPGSTYKDAHKRANLISCGEYHKVPIIDGANIPKIKKNIYGYYLDRDTVIYEKRCD